MAVSLDVRRQSKVNVCVRAACVSRRAVLGFHMLHGTNVSVLVQRG